MNRKRFLKKADINKPRFFFRGNGKKVKLRKISRADHFNMIIKGDNLKILKNLIAGKGILKNPLSVDIIYIDPPYNVGGKFGYINNYSGISKDKYKWAGKHGAFLDFMEPRLVAAKEILKESGVIFISICDAEYCRLKILADSVFGAGNCIGTIIWDKRSGAPGKKFTVVHEYILVYCKNSRSSHCLVKEKKSIDTVLAKADELKRLEIPFRDAHKRYRKWLKKALNNGNITKSEYIYNHLHPETYQPFVRGDIGAQYNGKKPNKNNILHPITKLPCKVPANGWRWSPELLKLKTGEKRLGIAAWRAEKGTGTIPGGQRSTDVYKGDSFYVKGIIAYGLDEKTTPRQIKYLVDSRYQCFSSIVSCVSKGKQDLPENITFSTPKPVRLIESLISSIRSTDITVMDFFAGSGTTAEVVHNLNLVDNGNRKWIMIEDSTDTFDDVLIPRIENFYPRNEFRIYR